MARHLEQDSTVRDYQAKLRYRVSFGFARRKWGDPLPVAVEEQDATVSWQLPNDLRVDMLGRRSASQLQGVDLASTFSHPWFVPRTLGDSLRIFGASQTPSRAAPHPLARGADRFYRYAAGDSVIVTQSGRRITIRSVTITPKFADGAYVAGRIWLDVSSGDVVRFTFRFVGTALWVDTSDVHNPKDSASAVRDSKFVSQILELNADLEFSLQDNTHWMPYRQVIAGKVSMPFGIDFAVPFEAKTTFDDYTVNSGKGGLRCGVPARYQCARPEWRATGHEWWCAAGPGRGPPARTAGADAAGDGVRFAAACRYECVSLTIPQPHRVPAGWRPLRDSSPAGGFDAKVRRMGRFAGAAGEPGRPSTPAAGDVGSRAHHRSVTALPSEMTGRPQIGIAWEKVSDILRYNRVNGTTLSIGVRVPAPISFTDIFATGRVGLADERLMARLAVVRDAPGGRLIVAGMRDLADIDAFSQGLTFGNSLRAIFTGHDDGAYLLAQGGRLSFETSAGGRGTEVMISARAEDERSVTSKARAFFPRIVGTDGYFPETTPVREGFAAASRVAVRSHRREHPMDARWRRSSGRRAGRRPARRASCVCSGSPEAGPPFESRVASRSAPIPCRNSRCAPVDSTPCGDTTLACSRATRSGRRNSMSAGRAGAR